MSAESAAAPDRRILFLRLSGFYGAFFLIFGVLMPFWPVWLDHRGLSAIEIASIMAAVFWVKMVAHPLVAHIADRRGAGRRLCIVLALVALAACLAMNGAAGFWPIALLAGLFYATHNPILPVMENITLRTIRDTGLDYGRIRLWGSISFILGTTATGAFLTGRDPDWVIWIASGSVALMLLSCIAMPEAPRTASVARANPLGLLARPDFLLFVATAGLLQISHAVYYAFGSISWRAAGLDESTIGMLWGVGVVAEVLLFAVAGRFVHRVGPLGYLAIAAVGGILRWPLTPLTNDPVLLVPLQCLHALTFGAAHLGAMAYLARNIPDNVGATGQSLYYALTGGVLMGAMMPLAGTLYESFGPAAYNAMGLCSLLALPGLFILKRKAPARS
ncbi:MAG: MFS transporter [Nisaea sp.]|uniref:MFS transporter n=1 Tax=Nisaea sp. TaxID=2024842 RepID=UPI001B1B58D2|nr:MFS transporter [Nisaea sp.]MBO6560188.1 MFS transporter [Nisaea sp.]